MSNPPQSMIAYGSFANIRPLHSDPLAQLSPRHEHEHAHEQESKGVEAITDAQVDLYRPQDVRQHLSFVCAKLTNFTVQI